MLKVTSLLLACRQHELFPPESFHPSNSWRVLVPVLCRETILSASSFWLGWAMNDVRFAGLGVRILTRRACQAKAQLAELTLQLAKLKEDLRGFSHPQVVHTASWGKCCFILRIVTLKVTTRQDRPPDHLKFLPCQLQNRSRLDAYLLVQDFSHQSDHGNPIFPSP